MATISDAMPREIIRGFQMNQAASRTASPFPVGTPLLTTPLLPSASLLPTTESAGFLREDYPAVKYWHRRDWAQEKEERGVSTLGLKQVTKGKYASMRFVEHENGQPIDKYLCKGIRQHCCRIWIQFMNMNQAPKAWTMLPANLATAYYNEMRSKFPVLCLCDQNWKSDQLAIDIYPGWYANQKSNVKAETMEVSLPSKPSSKRDIELEVPDELPRKKHKGKVQSVAVEATGSSSLLGGVEAMQSTNIAMMVPRLLVAHLLSCAIHLLM